MAKYPDWMPQKRPYTTTPEPPVEVQEEASVPQRIVRCTDCDVEMALHGSGDVALATSGMFRVLQEYLPLVIYECPQCGQYKFYKAPVEEENPSPRKQFQEYFKDYSKEQLQRIIERDGHPDAVAVARELLEKKFDLRV